MDEKLLKGNVDYIIKKVAGNSAEAESIEKWGIGALNSTYRVEIKNSPDKFFLKIENDNIIPSTRRGQIEREVKGIELMNGAGVPCPTVLGYDCSKKDIGKKYMLQEFVESDLLREIKDTLSVEENEYIKLQIVDIINKMKSVKSMYFGDIYENGTIGQHSSWKEAYWAMWKLLLADSMALELYNTDELSIIGEAGELALTRVTASCPASFYHGDLGKHNVLAGNSGKLRCIGTVIDFGNSIFTPCYMNEDGIRKYGGWDLEEMDVHKEYSIGKAEYETDSLVFEFEGTLFSSILALRRGESPGARAKRFLGRCRQYMNK